MRGPAAVAEQAIGLLEALGRAHHAVLEMTALLVAGAVERLQHLLADLRRLFEHGIDDVAGDVLEAGQAARSSPPCSSKRTKRMSRQGSLVAGHVFVLIPQCSRLHGFRCTTVRLARSQLVCAAACLVVEHVFDAARCPVAGSAP